MNSSKPTSEEIVIVSLDAHLSNEDKGKAFETFKQLPVQDKIALIQRTIEDDYPIIKEKNPDAKTIVFVAREYTIQGVDRRSISVEEKKALHAAMCDVTKDKPEVVLIPGPVLIRKTMKSDDQKKLQSYIQPHRWIKENPYEDNKEGIYHAEKELLGFFSTVEKYKTTAYVYAQGEIVGRVGKIAVRNESQFEPKKGVTQLAKGKSLGRLVKLENGLVLGFDICNDHNYGIVAKESKPVDIHFVLADSNFTILKFLVGRLFSVHVDSIYRSDVFLPKESKGSPVLYRQNILKQGNLIQGIPIYPLQFFVNNLEKQVNQKFPMKSNTVSGEVSGIANLSTNDFIKYQQQLNLLLQRVKVKNSSPAMLKDLLQIQNQFYILAAHYGLTDKEISLLKEGGIKIEVPEEQHHELETKQTEMDEDSISDEELLEIFEHAIIANSTAKDTADFLRQYLDTYGVTLDTPLGPKNHTLRFYLHHYHKNNVIALLEPPPVAMPEDVTHETTQTNISGRPRRRSL